MRKANVKSAKTYRNKFFFNFFPPGESQKEIFPNVSTEILIKLDQTLLSGWKQEKLLQSCGESVGFCEVGIIG